MLKSTRYVQQCLRGVGSTESLAGATERTRLTPFPQHVACPHANFRIHANPTIRTPRPSCSRAPPAWCPCRSPHSSGSRTAASCARSPPTSTSATRSRRSTAVGGEGRGGGGEGRGAGRCGEGARGGGGGGGALAGGGGHGAGGGGRARARRREGEGGGCGGGGAQGGDRGGGAPEGGAPEGGAAGGAGARGGWWVGGGRGEGRGSGGLGGLSASRAARAASAREARASCRRAILLVRDRWILTATPHVVLAELCTCATPSRGGARPGQRARVAGAGTAEAAGVPPADPRPTVPARPG